MILPTSMRSMCHVLTRALLALLLLGAGGVVVAEDHRDLAETPAAAVISQFSLLALVETHERGSALSLEHHPVCTDCTGFAAVVGVIDLTALVSPLVTAHAPVRHGLIMVLPVAFSPPAPPPR